MVDKLLESGLRMIVQGKNCKDTPTRTGKSVFRGSLRRSNRIQPFCLSTLAKVGFCRYAPLDHLQFECFRASHPLISAQFGLTPLVDHIYLGIVYRCSWVVPQYRWLISYMTLFYCQMWALCRIFPTRNSCKSCHCIFETNFQRVLHNLLKGHLDLPMEYLGWTVFWKTSFCCQWLSWWVQRWPIYHKRLVLQSFA